MPAAHIFLTDFVYDVWEAVAESTTAAQSHTLELRLEENFVEHKHPWL